MMDNLDEYYDFDNILRRMFNKIPDNIDKREGSIIYNALAPCANELAQMYIVLKDNIDLVFVDTAVDEYLDRICNQSSVYRKQATNSIRQAKFYDESNELMNVEIGERFTLNDLTYQVVEKISDGTYKCKCEIAGAEGNRQSGTLIPINYIQGLGKAVLEDVLILGEDEETDEALRNRYFESINEKSFAGNVADYKKNVKGISGVGAVRVTPCWNGGGTVKLTILDSDYNKASNTLMQNIQNAICPDLSNEGIGIAPIGHSVTVNTVEEVQINLSTTVTLNESYSLETVTEQIASILNSYLLELRKTWEENNIIVRIEQIKARILDIDGVLDINNTSINDSTSNIQLTANQICVSGEVSVS